MKLNYKRTVTVGLAFLSISAFWQLYDHVVPLMLKYTFGVNDALAGGIMALDNVLALILLPVFGSLSDRTVTRWGRRMPYIVIGGFSASVCMMLIPAADTLASLPLFVVGLGLTLLLMSSYRSPAVALMPDVTMRPLRSKGNAIINLMGTVGGIIILVLTSIMLPGGWKEYDAALGETVTVTQRVVNGVTETYKESYIPIYLCLMGIMMLATLIVLLRVNEPKLVRQMQEDSVRYGVQEEVEEKVGEAPVKTKLPPDVKRSMGFLLASIVLWFMGYNAVTTAFSKYCVERFGIGANGSALILVIAQAAAMVSFIPVGNIATKVGRKKTIMAGVLMLATAFAVGGTLDGLGILMYAMFVLAGIAWASINVNSYPMVVEMAHGADVGKFTGYYYTASMSAQIITPTLSGFLLQYVGYHTLFPYGAIFVALAFVTMLFVRHGDAKPTLPKDKLEMFEALDD